LGLLMEAQRLVHDDGDAPDRSAVSGTSAVGLTAYCRAR
jgi:hypothetical protein